MVGLPERLDPADDSLPAWTERYLDLAVRGVRSAEVTAKISRHLQRFAAWISGGLGHDRLSAVTPREVSAWRDHLAAAGNRGRDGTPAPMAPTTVNNHLAHLSALFSWITAHAPTGLLRHGDPTKKVAPLPLPLPLPAPQPRALAAAQIRTVKNIVDRIETLHELKGRRHRGTVARAHAHARPLRDRAIIHLLFGTGLRRAELVGLDLDQMEPAEADRLRQAKTARLVGVRGKGRTSRTIFVGRDARHALADYLEQQRPGDAAASTGPAALFLSAVSIAARCPDGRLSARSINTIVGEIGRLHDAQTPDPDRKLGTLRPHDARHTFAFQLSQASGHNRAKLERRLGHANDRYLRLYTNPPDDIAAGYIEDL
ncbi:tyrosine-type recombinase/integrase [Nonomuraea bangladeshensis]|uniref:tyrosine-type recombinase/integrase n=1 Tax=Nonomuraea bangladeshensis TaxID=404385 RepID=UPI0031D4F054